MSRNAGVSLIRVPSRGRLRLLWAAAVALGVLIGSGGISSAYAGAYQVTKLTDVDGGGKYDRFGYEVAANGDTVLIGAPYDDADLKNQGSASVFVRSGTGWALQAELTASDAAQGDQLGASVALDGDTALVGATEANVAGRSDAGAAYVFRRSPTGWIEQAKLTPPRPDSDSGFGYSVALKGDLAVVGELYADDSTGAATGAVHVFIRSGTTWTLRDTLFPSDGEGAGAGGVFIGGDLFGISVALDQDTLVVGAAGHGVGVSGATDAGAAYVFVRSGTGWTAQAELSAADPTPGAGFGGSVALSNGTALVGAELDRAGKASGSAYAFVRTGTTWAQQANLTPSDGAPNDQFGNAVALIGNTAVIGSLYGGPPGANGSATGAAYVFVRSGTSWTQRLELAPPDGAGGERFGGSVSLDWSTLVVGASFAPGGGAAYVYDR
ncbi:MAG: FG-GAP repeat protein [Geodermatophilaceae bacterium]